MWARLIRAIRSFFGLFVRSVENPELILQQLIDDMNSKVPKMNENVAQVMSIQKMLEQDVARLERQIAERDAEIDRAVQLATQDPKYEAAAKHLIAANETDMANLEQTRRQLEQARLAADRAKEFRTHYLMEIKQKQQEAMALIAESRRAEMNRQFAAILQSFEVGDEASTMEDMRRRIQKEAAEAESRVELATEEDLDFQLRRVRQATAQSSVDAKFRERQVRLGLVEEEPRKVELESSVEETGAGDSVKVEI